MNLAPRRAGFRLGAMITAGLGVAIMPWHLVESTDGYIFTWLLGYSALLGPIGGIVIADYFLVRRTKLDLEGLYRLDGPYSYTKGVNWIAMLALVLGVAPNVPGFIDAAMGLEGQSFWIDLYQYAWFVGFGISGVVYWCGMELGGYGQKGEAPDLPDTKP
jgi:NCS1 family nucleobase:cation symporter-1